MAFEKFFFLLCDASFNLLPYLSQLELSSQDLVFLLLKGRLAQVLGLQLVLKGLICGFWEKGLLLKNSPNTHRFLKHDDAGCQIHAKVYHGPVNALRHVLFLLNDKHVVIEELLQLFIDKVDGDLLKAIVLKDLKACNVQDSHKVALLHRLVN